MTSAFTMKAWLSSRREAHCALANNINGLVIDVETKSRHYTIECLGGNSVRISGHPEYCPEPTPAKIHGSIDKEGVLECGHIGRGMRLMFFLNDNRPVTTSRIIDFHIDPPKSGSNSPASIH